MAEDESARDRAERRVDRARDIYEGHGRVFRVVWIAVAVVIIVGGLAMTVLPGPATIVIPFGLAMLAVVFGWARRALLSTVEHSASGLERFRRASSPVKLLTVAAGLSVAAAVAAWFVL